MSELREAMAKLSPEQRAELEAKLTERRGESAGMGIPARPDPGVHPMSAGQERIFVMARLRPDGAIYNLQQAHHIEGPLDHARLADALDAVVSRHDALRARFELADGSPVQTIDADAGARLEVDDLSALPAGERFEAGRALAREDALRAFDLAHDGLLRARLIVLDAEEHMFVLTAHHIVCDAWSMSVIERELSALYRGDTLPDPRVQPSDVAAWEQTRADRGDSDLRYWRERLAGAQRLVLPTGRRRNGAAPDQGGHWSYRLSAETTRSVQDLSRAARVTPYTVLLAAFNVLLNRASEQPDLVVCAPAAGRTHPATHELFGYFNNLVALRSDLGGDPSFTELLGRTAHVVTEAFDHQAAPFQRVAGLPELATVPLTRALFILQESTDAGLDLPGATVSPVEIDADAADFDLALFVRLIDERYRIVVRYRQHLFTSTDVEYLLATYERLLEECLADPERRLEEHPGWQVPGISVRPEAPEDVSSGGPRNLLESRLRKIWEDVFRRGPIGIHDDFFELGGHSMLAATLMHQIEERVVDELLPLAALFHAPTVAKLATLIESGGFEASWSALVPIQPDGETTPLFFVHAHGGNVIGYRDLARRLGDDQPFYGLQSPRARAGDQEQKLTEMASDYITEVRTVQQAGPYLLGGWCLGGHVAFEMAQQLRRAGESVALVVMVDNPRPEFTAPERAVPLRLRLSAQLRWRLGMEWVNVREQTGMARFRHVGRRACRMAELAFVKLQARLDGTPFALPPSRAYREHRLALYHEKAYTAYDPEPYDGRVAVICAQHQLAGRSADPTLGWEPFLTGERDLIEAPGHRIGILSEPRVGEVARLMSAAMGRALDACGDDAEGQALDACADEATERAHDTSAGGAA